MVVYLLGTPGSGKTTAAGYLPVCCPATWPAHRGLVRAVVEAIAPVPAVLVSVCTPGGAGRLAARWLLLDCADQERRRLARSVSPDDAGR
jgi:hypothetical protein